MSTFEFEGPNPPDPSEGLYSKLPPLPRPGSVPVYWSTVCDVCEELIADHSPDELASCAADPAAAGWPDR